MKNEKGNKSLIITIIILLIALLGLSGYVINDKLFETDEVKVKDNEIKNDSDVSKYEEIGLGEDFKTLKDLKLDNLTEDYEKNYQITLAGEDIKLTISNTFDFDDIAIGGGENGEDVKSGTANIKFYLNDKRVFKTEVQTFAPSYSDPNEIIGIAIYNNEYLAIKQMLDPDSSYETQNTNNLISFVNKEGELYTESSYDPGDGMTFDGKYIYYYADEDGSFENSKRYWDHGLGCNKVFKWKKMLGESGTKLEEYKFEDTDMCL